MGNAKWLVFVENGNWRGARLVGSECEVEQINADASMQPDEIAKTIAQHLIDRGYRGEGIMLGLTSEQCLSASIDLSSARVRDRDTLTYELEEKLPLSMEDFVADFAIGARNAESVLGIAVSFDDIAPWVKELELQGVVVQSLSPVSMLALQEYIDGLGSPPDTVLWKSNGHVESFFIHDRKPIGWRILPADAKILLREMRIAAVSRGNSLRVKCCDLTSDLVEPLAKLSELDVDQEPERPLLPAAVATVQKALTGRVTPWFELRRGPLAPADPYRHFRGSLSLAAVVAVISGVIMCTSLFVRAQRYRQIAQQQQQRQETYFREIFPGQSIPAGIRSRLESEKNKLAGIAGRASDLPERPSALVLLHQLLKVLPNEPAIRLEEIRLEEGDIYLEGQVDSHGDAARISAALQSGGFSVEPPRSEQLSNQAVAVRITASLASAVPDSIQ